MTSPACNSSGLKVVRLTCEHLVDPLGLDAPRPRLSWELESDERGQRQTAYQILVASTPDALAAGEADLWDSGKVESDQSVLIPYDGAPLRSRMTCFWRVRVWDAQGRLCDNSPTARWEMGLLEESDWRAQWISLPGPHRPMPDPAPAPLLRKTFAADKPVRRARAYVCGLGYYELYVNGRRIGDRVLDPAFTRYDRRALYVAHDVTDALVAGANALGVMLGAGWYNCHTAEVWHFQQAPWRDTPKLLMQLFIEYEDGDTQLVCTDPTWKAATGPVVFDGLRNGETYDARKERPGWTTADYADDDWAAAEVVAGPGGVLRAQHMPPIRVTQTLTPVALAEPRPGVFVFDLGQAISGWARLTVSGPAGTEVTLRYAEKLDDQGDIDPSNINTLVKDDRFQTDVYILKGEGEETWEPRFTYHGFRYVQVTGFPGKPTLDSLRGRVVHTDLEIRGRFACSNELLNRIQSCCRWSTLCNYHGMPTDCPHREKNGWTGDALLSAEQTLLNFDPRAAYHKWLDDLADAQRPSGQLPGIVPTSGWGYNWGNGPAWDSAFVLIPWYLYLYDGDAAALEKHYESMKRYVDFLTTLAVDHIVSYGLGDWCPPGGNGRPDQCPAAVTSTAYYYVDAQVVARAAERLGKADEANAYRRLADDIRAAFLRRFYDPKTGRVANGSQTAMACALFQGLAGENERGPILAALLEEIERRDDHLDCGILGAKYLFHALSDAGRVDVAYRIATQRTYPSYGHWLEQGATTLWESWEGGSSRLHHMFSDISAWFYKTLAGIRPDPERPGFRRVVIQPRPAGDLQWARGEHRSPYGLVVSEWRKENGTFTLRVRIPANTTARVVLPCADADAVREGDAPAARAAGVSPAGEKDGCAAFDIESGEYVFSHPL